MFSPELSAAIRQHLQRREEVMAAVGQLQQP